MEFVFVIFVFGAIAFAIGLATRRSAGRRRKPSSFDGGDGFLSLDSDTSADSSYHHHDSLHHGLVDMGHSHDTGSVDSGSCDCGGGHH